MKNSLRSLILGEIRLFFYVIDPASAVSVALKQGRFSLLLMIWPHKAAIKCKRKDFG